MVGKISDRRLLTYGFNPQAEIRGANLSAGVGGVTFDVLIGRGDDQKSMNGVRLPMFGEHNVLNALAAIAVAKEMGIDEDAIIRALGQFGGVKRRFTKTGEAGGVTVIDDYGHHPVEIAAVLKAARSATEGHVVAVVQPHRYSRLSSLFEEFCACFNDADTVIVAPVYPAGEKPIPGYDRDGLVSGLKTRGHRHAIALDEPENLAHLISTIAKPGDMVVCLGAGTITNWANNLPQELAAEQTRGKGGG
jgi:UDP-N-acetylmuramate--alanine ligase